MRIRDIYIEGFGHFTARPVGPLERPVTVFYGPNEAGKSTYMQFIRAVLFGFPSYRGGQHYPPLVGGRHGGRLTVICDDGARYVIERFQGAGTGPVTVTTAAGEIQHETALARVLGHHSANVFKSIFAFTIEELQSDELLKDANVNGQIYSAGMGATGLPAAFRTLKAEKDRLFLKGGTKHAIAGFLNRLRDVDARLAEAADNAAEYGRLSGRVTEIEAALRDLSAYRLSRQSRLADLKRLESAWEDWVALAALDQRLSELPKLKTFPAEAVTRLEALELAVQTARREQRAAADLVKPAEDAAGGDIAHEFILSHAPEIQRILRGRTSFDNSVHDLPERQAELVGLERSLAETLREMGPDWSEARLVAFDLSVAVREEISRFQDSLRAARENAGRLDVDLVQQQRAMSEAEEAEKKARQDMEHAVTPLLDSEQVKQRRADVRKSRGTLSDETRARQRVADLRARYQRAVDEAASAERKATQDMERSAVPPLSTEEARQRRAVVRRARGTLGDAARARQRVTDMQSQLNVLSSAAAPAAAARRRGSGRIVAAVAAVAGIAVLAGGALLGGPALPIGVAAGVALIGVAVFLFVAVSLPPPVQVAELPLASSLRLNLQAAAAELSNIEAALSDTALALGLQHIDDAALVEADALLDEAEAALRERTHRAEALATARALVEQRTAVSSPMQAELRVAEAELLKLEEAVSQAASVLGLNNIDDASLSDLEASLDQADALHQERTRLAVTLSVASGLVESRQTRAEGAHIAIEVAQRKVETLQAEWRDWLLARGLRDTFTPETMVELRGKVDLARTKREEVQGMRRRIAAIKKDIHEYREIVEPLAVQCGIPVDDTDTRTIAAAADALEALYNRVEQQLKERLAAWQEMERAQHQLAQRDVQLGEAETALADLLASGGAKNVEDLRGRAVLNDERQSLEAERRQAVTRLQRLSGPGDRFTMLLDTLRDSDIQDIADQMRRIEEELKASEEEIQARSSERGSVEAELRRLIGEEESSGLRMERNMLIEQVRLHAHEWSRRTLAEELLTLARQKFERERQPGVVRHAERFFAEITDGRYHQVYAPLGEQTITVTDHTGGGKKPSELSRGTREQLFLALRFGLVRELDERAERLPVVVDEVLVNFDPARALRTALAFVELSQTNQVLAFTCHPLMVEQFQTAAVKAGAPEPQVIEL